MTQRQKAEHLLQLHHDHKLLVLPNIWDVLGAKLLEHEGFPAIATASAAVAFSRGYDDNQEISFAALLQLLESICNASSLPVTADLEKGYANSLEELGSNIKALIQSGVVGLNIEDSKADGSGLETIDLQCSKIKVIREVADKAGIPLVINARTDIFIVDSAESNPVSKAIERGNQYKDAGADCFYPILCEQSALLEINEQVSLPINVLAQQQTPSIQELEYQNISRLSLGPAFLRSVVTNMRTTLQAITGESRFDNFINDSTVTSKEIVEIIKS